jgi:DNA gyrase subunit B
MPVENSTKTATKFPEVLHGVGVSCVNALSTIADAWKFARNGKLYMQEYANACCPSHRCKRNRKLPQTTAEQRLPFCPMHSIFIESVYKYDILANRLRELAYLNAGITLTLTDKRVHQLEDGSFKSETFHSRKKD